MKENAVEVEKIELEEEKYESRAEYIKAKVKQIAENVEDFMEDHGSSVFYVGICAGAAIIYGQSIRYMHLLNKAAKNGYFMRT